MEYFNNQDYPKAREYFYKVVKVSIDQPNLVSHLSWAYYNLGLSFAFVGDLQNALPYLEKSIEVMQGNAWAHLYYELYLYYYNPQLKEKSISHFNTALELSGYRDEPMWEIIIPFLKGVNLDEEVSAYCNLAKEKGIVLAEDLCP